MNRTAIIGREVIGPARNPEGLKWTVKYKYTLKMWIDRNVNRCIIHSPSYTKLLKDALLPWDSLQTAARKRRLLFMQDNAPAHMSHLTNGFLAKKGLEDGCPPHVLAFILSWSEPHWELLESVEEVCL